MKRLDWRGNIWSFMKNLTSFHWKTSIVNDKTFRYALQMLGNFSIYFTLSSFYTTSSELIVSSLILRQILLPTKLHFPVNNSLQNSIERLWFLSTKAIWLCTTYRIFSNQVQKDQRWIFLSCCLISGNKCFSKKDSKKRKGKM